MQQLDTFGHKFTFFMSGHRSIKTFTGFIVTLLATAAIVASCVVFYSALQDTTLPTIKTEAFTQDESPSIRLVEDVFMFISLVNFRTIIPTSYLPIFNRMDVRLVYEEVRNDPFPLRNANLQKTETSSFSMVACNTTAAWKKNKPYLTSTQIAAIEASGWCLPDPSPADAYALQSFKGKLIADKKLSIRLYPCVLPSGCLPFEKKKDLFFVLGFLEYGYNGQDFDKPILRMLNLVNRFQAYEGYHKNFRVQLGQFTSETLTSQVTSTSTVDTGFFISATEPPNIEPHGGTPSDPLLTIEVEASTKVVVYHRSYGSLVDFISNLGGITQITLSLAFLLYSLYSGYVYRRDLIVRGVMNLVSSPNESDSKKKDKSENNEEKKKLTANYSSFWKFLLLKQDAEMIRPKDGSLESVEEYRRVKYWQECEKVLDRSIDIFHILPMLNELAIMRRVFLKDYHSRLAPRVGGLLLQEDIEDGALIESDKKVEEWIKKQQAYEDCGHSTTLSSFRLNLAKQIMKDYKAYIDRENAEFTMLAGIKNLMEVSHILEKQKKTDKEHGHHHDDKLAGQTPSQMLAESPHAPSLHIEPLVLPNAKLRPRKTSESSIGKKPEKIMAPLKVRKRAPSVQKFVNVGSNENFLHHHAGGTSSGNRRQSHAFKLGGEHKVKHQ